MPSNWAIAQLGELVVRVTEKNTAGESNVLTISARKGLVNQRDYFNKDVASKDLSSYFLLRRGDFAYNKSKADGYPLGAIKRLDLYPAGVVSPLYICFRLADEARACSDFLSHFFESGLFNAELRAIAKEGARSHGLLNVKPGEFLALPVPLPSLTEQRKIAAILSSVDEAIEKTEAVIAQLDVVKKAMLEELLTRGIPGRHSRFKQTEIGEVPEEWRVESLGKLLREPIRNGYSPVCPKTPTGRWILHLGSVTFDGFDAKAVKPAPPDDARVDQSRLEVGDLLVSRSNTQERVGLAGIYWGEPTPCSYPDLLMRVRPRAELEVRFLELALLSGMGRAYFERTSRGTSGSMKKIDRAILESFPIAVPDIAEQAEIVAVASSIRARLRSEEAVLAALAETRAALSASLLTGRVRVPA